ncbi:hypothetical protein SAMN02745857_02757 [Andreprevotia lacus DSM 23236]|jgi:hypothetical protein|uniref:Uncharacterized protein n=1 Tax=Andreprevotia lacus DSM 23236 TaxID=1121001 RepID=A0A1W1XTN6_9NEIS|nr:hypothetical protein [Andreprevotia lacus]SMC27222.1 hypothetical protein SAMN02745857_02757 [Andreprevotia lacus DSM 23236]
MNYLQLVQRTWRECGLAGEGPAGVSGQRGMERRIVDWVAEAWSEIQGSRQSDPLPFMLCRASLPLAAGVQSASLAVLTPPLRQPDISYARLVYPDRVVPLSWRTWDELRPLVELRNGTAAGTPALLAVDFQRQLRLDRPLARDALLEFDYLRQAQQLQADGDVPILPDEQDHLLIVWRAAMLYAGFDSASEVYQTAQANYLRMLARLVNPSGELVRWDVRPLA